jgi:hypothetical protein
MSKRSHGVGASASLTKEFDYSVSPSLGQASRILVVMPRRLCPSNVIACRNSLETKAEFRTG